MRYVNTIKSLSSGLVKLQCVYGIVILIVIPNYSYCTAYLIIRYWNNFTIQPRFTSQKGKPPAHPAEAQIEVITCLMFMSVRATVVFASTVCCNILFITKSDKFMFDQKLRYYITNFTDKLETENSTNIIIIVIHSLQLSIIYKFEHFYWIINKYFWGQLHIMTPTLKSPTKHFSFIESTNLRLLER